MLQFFRFTGKLILLTIVFASGLIGSRIIFYNLGIWVPRMPTQADEATAIYYLLAGSFLFSTGTYPLVRNIAGTWLLRFSVILTFLYLAFGIGVTLESSIFTSVRGYNLMMLILFPPVLLYSLAVTIIDKPRPLDTRMHGRLIMYFRSRKTSRWMTRLLIALFSWPLIYFIFGMAASPMIAYYYEGVVEGLKLPDPGLIFGVQLTRSLIYIVITIPVVLTWAGSGRHLVLSLGSALFVFVFGYDLVLAVELPSKLLIVHGIEILLDSFVYSWVLITCLRLKNESRMAGAS